MALNEQATVTLSINGDDAKKKLEDLRKQASNLSEAIRKAYEAGDDKTAKKLTTEYRKTQSEINKTAKAAENLNTAMNNLSTATPKQLRAVLSQINRELNSGNIKRGSAEWNAYNQQLIRVKTELAKINEEQKAALPLMDRMGSAMGRLKGLAIAGGVGIAGLGAAIGKMREYRDEKDTAKAGLQAITGLDDNSVAWLQEQAEQMSQTMDQTGLRVTQSASEIMEAYKLVGSAKPELLSVKEDLNAVTVEAIRLSQAAGIDLNTAVQAVTVSMNQFGASAEETDRYVNVLAAGSKVGAVAVDGINAAVEKAGVAASQANLKIEDLVGAIETIGERGLQGDKAGTALKSFFLKLTTGADETNPKIHGLQKALENLAAQNLSEGEMLKRFGAEAYNVAAILTESTDKLEAYTKGVTGTQTAVEQAARMGQTYAAASAQMRNQLAELGQEILKTIQPALTGFMNKTTGFLKVLGTLLKVVKDYGGAIAAIVAPLVAYNVALAVSNALHSKGVVAIVNYTKALFSMNTVEKAGIAIKNLFAAATALMTGNIKKASIAFKAFSKVLMASPIGLIAAAITAVVVGLIAWTRRSKELTQEQKNQKAVAEMNLDIEKQVNEQTATEISRIEKLRSAIHNKNLSEKTRKQAIQDLQKILPNYNAELTREGDIINENKKAVDEYIESLKEKARVKIIDQKLSDVIAKQMNIEDELKPLEVLTETSKQAQEEFWAGMEEWQKKSKLNLKAYYAYSEDFKKLSADAQKYAKAYRNMYGVEFFMGDTAKQDRERQKRMKELREQAAELAAMQKALEDRIRANIENTGVVPGTSAEETTGGNGNRKDQLEALKLQAEKARLEIEKAFIEGKTLYGRYKKDLLDVDKWLIGRQQALFSASESEWIDYERQKLELRAKYTALDNELLIQAEKEQTTALQLRYARAEITTEKYQQALTDIEVKTLEQRLKLYQANSKEYADINAQLQQKLAEQDKQARAVRIKDLEDEHKALANELALRLAQGKMSEATYNEAVHQAEIAHLRKVRDAYVEFSDDYIKVQKQIEDAEAKHQQQLAKLYSDGLRNFNAQYTTKAAEQEYMEGAAQIDKMLKAGDVAFEDAARAKSDLAQKLLDAHVKHIEGLNLSVVDSYKARYEKIAELEQQGVISHEQAEQAKLKATTDMLGQISTLYESAWGSIDTVLQASSNLIQANADVETAKIESEYEKRIDAAGRNHRKVERLEKERDEKLRAMKTKANEKAMKIELASAIAQTAASAINAYSSAAAIPIAGFVLGPIAAAAALAAGAIQIATIKKQQQAESAGYASGGFTPSGRWDKPQGVVHSDEFVANRFATGNQEILPALQLIDRAQKNNTVGSLTAADVTNSLYPSVPAQRRAAGSADASNAAIAASATAMAQTAAAVERLNEQLADGITAYTTISGKQGIAEQTKKYNQLINNAK